MGIVSILLVNIIDNDNDYCYHRQHYSWIELVRMYSLKGHICSAHKAWLTSNPRASLRAWDESLEIGLFGRDLLDPDHAENMYNDLDVEPGKVERTFLLSITKKF